MQKKLKIISNAPFFNGLPEEQLNKILNISVIKQFNKDDFIFLEQDDGNGFYIVIEGMIKIFKLSLDGKEQILHFFGPGEPFGEVPVFSGKSFPANAQAIKKSETIFFPKQSFIKLISQNPSITMNMLSVLSKRLREFTVQIENLSLKEIPGRIAAYLIFLSKEQDNKNIISLNISKGQLASLLGTIPETLSRILGKMSDQKLIKVNGKKIIITDKDELKNLAE